MNSDSFLLRNEVNGLVIQPESDNTSLGTIALHTARADGSELQRWTLEPGGFVTNVVTGFVLDIEGANRAEDTPVLAARRNASLAADANSNQQWDLTDEGTFQSRFNGFKLDILSRNAAVTAVVAHSDRDGRLHEGQAWQRWYGQA